MPDFTPNERRRFEETLREARLVDVWRHLHPAGVATEVVPYLGLRGGGTTERNVCVGFEPTIHGEERWWGGIIGRL